MRWIDGLTKAQRIVLVIAFGLALWALGNYLVSLGAGFGWTGYAPFTAGGGFYAPARGLHGWLRLIIWLVLIALWAVASLRVLRPRSEETASD
jgi:hypothetical protein